MQNVAQEQEDVKKIKVRELRKKNYLWLDNDYFNGFGKIFGPCGIAVYVCLCRHADNDDQDCYPSIKKIAEECNMSVNGVKEYLDHLEASNIIKREARFSKKGGWPGTTFTLLDKSTWGSHEEALNRVKLLSEKKATLRLKKKQESPSDDRVECHPVTIDLSPSDDRECHPVATNKTQYKQDSINIADSPDGSPAPAPSLEITDEPTGPLIEPTAEPLKEKNSAKKEKSPRQPNGNLQVVLEMFRVKGLPTDTADPTVIAAAKRHFPSSKELLAAVEGDVELAKKCVRIYANNYKSSGAKHDWWLGPVIKAAPQYKAQGKLSTAPSPNKASPGVYSAPEPLMGQPFTPGELLPPGWFSIGGRLWPNEGGNEMYLKLASRYGELVREGKYADAKRLRPRDLFGEGASPV